MLYFYIIFFNTTLKCHYWQKTNNPINEKSNNTILDVVTNYTGDAAFVALDFIPYVGNVKNLGEAIFGKDLVTGKALTNSERIVSLVGAMPFANYFKGGKHYKNVSTGKMINGIKFAKAGARALSKPNAIQKILKAGNFVAKATKSLSKIIRKGKQLRLWNIFFPKPLHNKWIRLYIYPKLLLC